MVSKRAAMESRQATMLHRLPSVEWAYYGNRTYLMADDDGQILGTHSISAGLDYPGVGPEHSFLKDIDRVQYVPCTDEEAMHGFRECTQKKALFLH